MIRKKVIAAAIIIAVIVIAGIIIASNIHISHKMAIKADEYTIIDNTDNGTNYLIKDKNEVTQLNDILSGKYKTLQYTEEYDNVSSQPTYTILPTYYNKQANDTLVKNYNTYPEMNAEGKNVIYGESIYILDETKIAIWNASKQMYQIAEKTDKPVDMENIKKMLTKSNFLFQGSM